MKRYIFVTGGVYSGTGKGVSCASIGLLLKMRGHKVQCIKFDPYLNTSASVLAPTEHGEVWVTEDGWECDLDIGTYERISRIAATKNNIFTSGELYSELIKEHEEGKYLGQTIQINTHFCKKFREKIHNLTEEADIVIIEIGGTVGDIESAGFYEAIRQFKQEQPNDVLVLMVAPILWVKTIKEYKTKPLQNAVKTLQSQGIQPDLLLCRVEDPISNKLLDKVSRLTNIPRECVFDCPDVNTCYEIPIVFFERHIDDVIADKFHLRRNGVRIHKYRELVEKYNTENKNKVVIGIAGKYENCDEAYVSLKEAIYDAAIANNVQPDLMWIDVENIPKDLSKQIDCLIVPGGFGNRGIEGKIQTIKLARENNIPFLGICLGLQCAVIEFARNILNIKDSNSQEFDLNTKNPVVHYLPGQQNITNKSGTMRLGSFNCELIKDSISYSLYRKRIISERHRHRYEVNSKYEKLFSEHGFEVVGKSVTSGLIEIMELKNHPYFIGTQAHPEFKSRLGEPSPLFYGLIQAAIKSK